LILSNQDRALPGAVEPVEDAMMASLNETLTEVELDPVKQQVDRFFKQDLEMDAILRN
jgi:hypothetical protein